MFYRRGVIVLLLFLIVVGFVVQAFRGPAAATQPSTAASPTPAPTTAQAQAVIRSLAAVQRAYDAGNARRLCRPGAIVDAAVIRRQRARFGGCESRIESLMGNRPRLRFTVRRLTLEPDLAIATVTTAKGTSAPVDLVRRDGRRWLLSFSNGTDPLPALAGTE